MFSLSFDEFVALHGIAGALRQLEMDFSDLDDIARFAAFATHRPAASIYLCWEHEVYVIGGYNVARGVINRTIPDEDFIDGVAEYDDAICQLDLGDRFNPVVPDVRALALFQMKYEGEVIGGISVHSPQLCQPLSDNERKMLSELAKMTEDLVARRALLKYVAFLLQPRSVSYKV